MKKKLLILMGVALGVLLAAVFALFINHRIQLKHEKDLLKPIGELVEVDGARMSVYAEGEGDRTLVFLSGGGTCSPILDFKSLYSLLSDTYRIAVVEKFGYGFSDVTDKSRDIDTILENTREALRKAGLTAPFVLCPHSMSGIEALYWAQKYPDEVSAIIGLDMAVPKAYEEMQINGGLLRLLQFGSTMGITRLGSFSDSAAILGGTLTEKEKDIYRAVFFTRTMTDDMINETLAIKESAAKVGAAGIPDVPILLFCSDASGGVSFSKEKWQKMQSDFASEHHGDIVYLDCGHYVHNYAYVRIAEEIKGFLR